MTGRARDLRRDAPVPERILWGLLRGRGLVGLKFRRQAPVGPFVVDFICEEKKLVVELDGLSHVARGVADARRSEYLTSQGLRVVRVTNDQVLGDMEMVAIDILRAVGMEGEIVPGSPVRSAEGDQV